MRTTARSLIVAALATIGATAPTLPAQENRPREADPRIDPQTGRDVRVWPPDVLFDHLHMRLEMTIPDMSRPAFSGVQTLTVAPIAVPRDRIVLDAGKGLTFSQVWVDGKPAVFSHDKPAAKLTIEFPSPAHPGRVVTLRMAYNAERPGGGGSGLTFSKDYSRTPEWDPMCHAQGEPQNNHLWFPCHDFPNERLSSELIVTVPAPFEAVSNGRLVSVTYNPNGPSQPPPPPPQPDSNGETPPAPTLDGARGTRTYHWLQDKDHTSYLVTLVVGRFEVINVGGPGSAYPGLWMPVYGPLGSGEAQRRNFANTAEMVRHFEDLFEFPYPWEKYAQIFCRDFSAGAMENTSATTFHESMARGGGRRGSMDGIIAHELVHQWFGNVVTCKGWEHLWLNEGWATMGEALWEERQGGDDAYQAAILGEFASTRSRSAGRSWPANAGMVNNRYRDPNRRFTEPDNVYQKGGSVLHMLRMRLGDELFFAGSRNYLKRHQYGYAETDDFRRALEEVSGQSLERFFDQWCRRPGIPALEIDYTWTPDTGDESGAGTLDISVEQTQRINADNPAFAFQLPIYAKVAGLPDGRSGQYVYFNCDSRAATQSFRLAARPSSLSVDPYLTVLCSKRVRQPLEAHLDQLRDGPTLDARLQAIDALARSSDLRAVSALASVWLANAPAASAAPGHRARRLIADRAGDALRSSAPLIVRSFRESGGTLAARFCDLLHSRAYTHSEASPALPNRPR